MATDNSIPSTRPQSATHILDKIRAGLPGGGESRPGQVKMAEAVEATIRDGGTLVVQAGTGQGKSLAYVSGAVAAGQKTVIATSSIALQDQLTKKDLPLVAEQLEGTNFKYAVLKGRSNYACRLDLADLANPGSTKQGRLLEVQALEEDGADADQIGKIFDWVVGTQTGDKAELPFEPSLSTWGAVSRTSETCVGKSNCKFSDSCFTEIAREKARDADVIVVNTHLYALNVAAGGSILPAHSALVFDEAHEVESILSSALGSQLGAGTLRGFHKDTKRVLDDEVASANILVAANELEAAISEVAHPNGLDKPPEDIRLLGGARSIERLANALDQAANTVGLISVALQRIPDTGNEKVRNRKKSAQLSAQSIMDKLVSVSVDDKETVVWIEGGRSIKTAPINVGEILDRWFWSIITNPTSHGNEAFEDGEEDDVVLPPSAVVFTSATLPSSLANRLHVPKPRNLDVGSPFNFRDNAILYVPNIVDPKTDDAAWKAAAHQEMRDLITAAGGRTLALFTSNRAMQEAYAAVATLPYRILVQGGDLPKRVLVEEFSKDPSTCLFATRTFFQGVDIPGQTLSLVILDRIPFPRPGEPLIEAWVDTAGGGWKGFEAVSIPIAATTLAQGAGRLIRSATDHGVVAVLDSRLAEAGYRTKLLSTFPPMRRRRNKETVINFLRSIASETTELVA